MAFRPIFFHYSTSVTEIKHKKYSVDRSSTLFCTSTSNDDETTTAFDEISDEDMKFIMEVALGEDHKKALNKMVEDAMLEDWDVEQGVVTGRRKPLPLKANIDMWSFQARQELRRGNFSGSEMLYRQCISYNPCDGRAWLGIAQIYWKRGKPDMVSISFLHMLID